MLSMHNWGNILYMNSFKSVFCWQCVLGHYNSPSMLGCITPIYLKGPGVWELVWCQGCIIHYCTEIYAIWLPLWNNGLNSEEWLNEDSSQQQKQSALCWAGEMVHNISLIAFTGWRIRATPSFICINLAFLFCHGIFRAMPIIHNSLRSFGIWETSCFSSYFWNITQR